MSRRGGFRRGYHPTPDVLPTLRIFNKKKRNYVDESGNVYSNRAVQEARYGYVTLEEAKQLRKQGWGDILNFKKRGEIPFSLHVLAAEFERRYRQPRGTAFTQKRFRRKLEQMIEKVQRFEEDEDYYDELEEFLDDSFGLAFEEIAFYAPHTYGRSK